MKLENDLRSDPIRPLVLRIAIPSMLAQGAAEQGQPGQQEQPQCQPRGGGPGHGAHSSSLTRRSR